MAEVLRNPYLSATYDTASSTSHQLRGVKRRACNGTQRTPPGGSGN